MSDMIAMRCDFCGNAVRVERADYDPPAAVVRVTNECNICNNAEGGFEECWYFDAAGNEISGDESEWSTTRPSGPGGTP